MSLDEKLVRPKSTIGALMGAGMYIKKLIASHEMSRDWDDDDDDDGVYLPV
jgi:hypothetical protein